MIKTITGDFFEHEEAANALGIKASTLYKYNSNGSGPKRYRIGVKLGYKFEDLIAWAEARFELKQQ